MATLYRRANGVWYVRYSEGGTRKWRTLGTRNARLANAKRKELEDRLKAGLPGFDEGPPGPGAQSAADREPVEPGGPGAIAWDALQARYERWAATHVAPRTLESRLWALKSFQALCAAPGPGAVTLEDVERYKEARRLEQCTPHTVNDAIGALKALVNRALKQGWYAGPNVFAQTERVPVPRSHPQWLSGKQIAAVMEKAELHGRNMHLVFGLGIYAGLRKREIVFARWDWIDFEAGLIHVKRGPNFELKDREERTVPLHEALRGILLEHRTDMGYLVAPQNPPGTGPYRFNIRKGFAAVAKAAGVPWCTPHVLRHTFASQLASAGVDLYKIKTWLGHSSVNTTQIYAHLRPRDEDINRLGSVG